MPPRKRPSRPQPDASQLRAAFGALERLRRPLFRELDELLADPEYVRQDPGASVCRRPKNHMWISPLEAEAIVHALQTRPELRAKLPGVLRRLRRELPRLQDHARRQPFDCPLLEKGLCLVHHAAKPVGCLAWNPGREYTDAAWRGFEGRDKLNDELYGPKWRLRVIPLWMARILGIPRR